MSELTKEELDEMQGVVTAAKQSGFGKVELAIDIALELLALARRLQAIEQAGGVTAEQRTYMEEVAGCGEHDLASDCELVDHLIETHERASKLLTKTIAERNHLAAEVERLRTENQRLQLAFDTAAARIDEMELK